jgi:2-aminobenzoate-CoA ligase
MNDVFAASLSPSGHTDGFARAHLPPPDAWPDFLFTLPELQYPGRLNCAGELLNGAIARGWGGRTALIGARERLTYAELLAQVDRVAHVLRHDLGLATGNRVLVRGANCPMMAACILGVIKAGCIVVPTMPLLRARELGAIADKARINAVLCAGGLVDEVDALGLRVPVLVFDDLVPDALEERMALYDEPFIAADTGRDDVCLISFTSGTTGIPKGTMHFHRDVLAVCDCFPRHTLASRQDDIFIGTPPLAFTFGLGGLLLFPLRVGGAGVLIERLTPELLLQAIAEHRATVCFTAPTFYRLMAAHAGRFDLSSLRASVSAGEPLPLATREAWQAATGLAMIDGIGATELLHIFIASAGEAIRPGATGKPVAGYQACILDADGMPVGPGVIGRLAVKGPTGCRYLDDERQLDYVQGGWNVTGDAYEMDGDGYFYYRSRTDDMIISAGYNIAGAEVEEALLHHPAVAECGVVGRIDPDRGQVVVAHVVLRAGQVGSDALAHELQEFVKEQIAPYKYPRAILFKEQLPRTETGKLQRFKLRTNAI